MTDARTFLIGFLRRIIDGGDVTNDDLNAATVDPAALRGAERNAWHGLSYWLTTMTSERKTLHTRQHVGASSLTY